ncbi:MAG: four helix bundle protein [Bacteroidota bacterium]
MILQFEELECWQAARGLTRTVFQLTNRGGLSEDYDTRGQLRRAALNTMNNIAEGFARFQNEETMYYLDVAQSAAAEVKSILYLIEDLKYLDKTDLDPVHEQVNEMRKLTRGFMQIIYKSSNN